MTTRRGHLAAVEGGPAQDRACQLGRCDGSGWILDAETGEAHSCECRERRVARARTRGVSTVIPRKFQGVSLDRPPISDMARDGRRDALSAVRMYIDEIDERVRAGRGLWIMGPVGTGKTSLGMLVAKAALDAGFSVAIYSVPHLLSRIRRTYDTDSGGQSYLEFFERLATVDLLHLDDLGSERRNDWVLEQLYAIVNRRYEDELAMTLTMNDQEVVEAANSVVGQDPATDWTAALGQLIGRRTVSRLAEICDEWVLMSGADKRFHIDARASRAEPR